MFLGCDVYKNELEDYWLLLFDGIMSHRVGGWRRIGLEQRDWRSVRVGARCSETMTVTSGQLPLLCVSNPATDTDVHCDALGCIGGKFKCIGVCLDASGCINVPSCGDCRLRKDMRDVQSVCSGKESDKTCSHFPSNPPRPTVRTILII